LESQRRFFEDKLQFVEDVTHERLEELEQSNKMLKERAQQLQSSVDVLNKDKLQQEKRSQTKVNKLQHDFDEERLMNEQLRQNQTYFQSEMVKLREEFDSAMKQKNQVRSAAFLFSVNNRFSLSLLPS
jgi:hypothetical protein